MTRTLAFARWWAGAVIAATLPVASAVTFAAAFSLTASAQGSLADVPLPPDEAAQKQVIADVKAKALDYEKNLPDFVCTQQSHHNVDVKSMNQWKTTDTVSEQLRFIHREEEYTLLALNGKKASGGEKRPPGLVSMKTFGDVLHDIFDPSAKVDMSWAQWDSVRGHRAHVISFLVRKDLSLYTIGKSKGIQTGIGGWIYTDAETSAVLRVVMAATEVPKTYPIQNVATDMYYDYVRMGDKIYLFPIKADFREKQGKSQVWDEVELKDFHKP